jgi:hypothetical protein
LLHCPGGDCAWRSCSDAILCPDGGMACGRACPDHENWSWSDFATSWGAP